MKVTSWLMLLILPQSLAATWYWVNPKPQGNVLRAVYFVDNMTGYAVGERGGSSGSRTAELACRRLNLVLRLIL